MTPTPVHPAKRSGNIHLSSRRSNTTPPAAQASDADLASIQLSAQLTAPGLKRKGVCTCLPCLVDMTDGDFAFCGALCAEIERLEGYPVVVRPCDSPEGESELLGPLW
jgi:hypothetical protein